MSTIIDGTAGITFPNSTTQAGAVSQPAAPFTANGVVYASSTSALATGSALTWNGTNFNISTVSNTTLKVRNSAAGTSNYSQFSLGNDADADLLYIQSYSSTYTSAGIAVANGVAINGEGPGGLSIAATQAPIRFYSGGSSETMRLDSSGNLLVGTTTSGGWQGNAKTEIYSNASTFANPGGITLSVYQAGTNCVATNIRVNSTSVAFMQFQYNGATTVGSITTNGSSTSYVTSSDYRLKDNITPMTGALAKVTQLKPVTYKWKADNSDGQGFIAHELQEIIPDAVVGQKDAVDEDGKPKYQGIDTSFLVATLAAAIQELNTLVTTQSAEIAALKAKVGI
jgi:hypothetical protein